MPRIVPIQLLKCLKVLLDDNGGILSAGEVKRIASLMTKYSKKLVSKCIYVQILKCTKTELLGEFMGAGGWSLVYTWLNDAIRAMNWPLVQEILELLLLCPVDVHRLKINSAPKLVKGLCKDGGNEGVRILAKRLVEQWLKIVTDNPESSASKTPASTQIANQNQSVNKAMTPQQSSLAKTSTTTAITPVENSVSVTQSSATVNSAPLTTSSGSLTNVTTTTQPEIKQSGSESLQQVQDQKQINNKEKAQQKDDQKEESQVEQDPLGEVQDVAPTSTSYTLTPAQKKASESGLVYKIVVKDGQQVLAKVAKPVVPIVKLSANAIAAAVCSDRDKEKNTNDSIGKEEDDTEDGEGANSINDSTAAADVEEDDNSSSLDKTEKESENNSSTEEEIDTTKTKHKSSTEADRKNEDKKSEGEKEKSGSASRKEHRRSKDSKDVKERRSSSSGIEKDKEKDKDGKSKSSSSSGHKSSSHKSSSSKSSSSSSSSKSKSSSSSHRSSSDKHRSDKDRSSSYKEKEKDRSSGSSSSSSSKHKSSSKSSSSSYSSSTKDKHRDKEREKSSSSSSVSSFSANKSKDKERSDKDANQIEKDKTTSNHERSNSNISTSPSIDKLGRIPKKSKDDASASTSDESQTKPTSITIPFKKASISIEIRRDSEKAKTVKTYKSQFRSHGLTEEAPPPPSRKGLKKPSFGAHTPGTILPTSLPSSLKRSSPTPRDSPGEKRSKIDLNNVTLANEKPGAIKLIPPKKIQTLVETNLFSDALSAATGPKKITKRKRPVTPSASTGTATSSCNKEGPSSSTSPDLSKVVSLKFYQDTLDESKTEDSKSDKENESDSISKENCEDSSLDKDIEDDDDIPLKKVKEDIEQKVAKERKMDVDGNIIDLSETEDLNRGKEGSPNENSPNEVVIVVEDEPSGVRKPGPGCGPNGPPGVLMLHRRKGPKKKLSWSPQETLEQIRYFELDETERVNVTKTSFMDMKNLERFNERDAIIMSRRGFQREDNMEAQTTWKPLIEVEDVPHHPDGSQSKQRKIQAEREMTTLRALYFSHAIIPDSPAEAEIEPVFAYDVPVIPLDDLTGNPDAVNDFTSMPWPEPKGSPKQGDNALSGTGGLGSPVDMFAGPVPPVIPANTNNPFNPFLSPFGSSGGQAPQQMPLQNGPQSPWQNPPNAMGPMGPGNGPLLGNPFNGHSSPTMDMGGPGMGPVPMVNNGPPQNFLGQFGPNGAPFGAPPSSQFGPPNNAMFNGPPKNFGPMGPMPLMGPNMNMLNNNGPMMNGPNQRLGNNRNNGGNGNWRTGGSNFQDNNSGNNWRPNISNRGNSGGGNNSNNGVCKAFMRGHCHLGKSCKYIHPKRKRI